MVKRIAVRSVLGAVLIGALVLGGTVFRVWQVARIDERPRSDMIVVLGAAQYNGEPSAILGARLDHAARLYREGVAPTIVTVGGKRVGDNYTEGETGRNYLVQYGIPEDAVVALGEGNDTLGSIRAVAEYAAGQGWSTAVIVSDPWHSLRSATMARDHGLQAATSPTRSGPIVQTRAVQAHEIGRESIAMVYYQLTHGPAALFTTVG